MIRCSCICTSTPGTPCRGGGQILLETEDVRLDEREAHPLALTPGKYVKITVADTGTGMDESTKGRILDPFFATKDVG